MVFVVTGIALLSGTKFAVCEVPKIALTLKRLVTTFKKPATEESTVKVEVKDRWYVDNLLMSEDDMNKVLDCTNGCGRIIREAMDNAETLAPELVKKGELCRCVHCGEYKNT